jgi:hypothetical protein
MNFVIGDCDGIANAIVEGSRFALEACAQHCDSGIGSLFTGCVTTHTIHDKENAAYGIHVKAIFVLEPLQSRMRVAGRAKRAVWIADRERSVNAHWT